VIVVVVAKNALSIVPSREDVIQTTFDLEPGFSPHTVFISNPATLESQYRKLWHPGSKVVV
jgi:hypothetical protein